MAKKLTHTLALRIGHTTPFRRTVTVGKKNPQKYQLVFEPGRDYEVTDEELAGGLQKLVDGGLLVNPHRDARGRQRRPAVPTADPDATIEKLEKKVETLAAENSVLKSTTSDEPTPE